MGKGKDFYGKDIAEVIEQACRELGASREELNIEVIETGSAGIFGLCKKKAHIRVQRKAVSSLSADVVIEPAPVEMVMLPKDDTVEQQVVEPIKKAGQLMAQSDTQSDKDRVIVALGDASEEDDEISEGELGTESEPAEETATIEPPSEERLDAIRSDLHRLLTLMGLPSEVDVRFEEHAVQCTVTGQYEEHIVGPEGRTLDSLQYLLRKMVADQIPDRIMLVLNAGHFRERRTEELKIRAVELAAQVKADGKTLAIPALNPSERRVVHMVLQDDKGVRSRSVGEGLFKKVLIYKPGKGRRPASKKRRGGQGGRSSGD